VAYTVSTAGLKQTSWNVAATLTAAQIQAGILDDPEVIDKVLKDTALVVFEDLKKELGDERPNVPTPRRSNAGENGGAPGDTKFNFGKHFGKTIAAVQAEDPSYITWLTTKDTKQPRDYIRSLAVTYLDSLKA
jgi:hypothetical protein